ncbi:MAG: hypothetical protein CMN21_13245 [Rubinisphaera sp.]|nr:hypothetical protein [Rubinisphaera sp.]
MRENAPAKGSQIDRDGGDRQITLHSSPPWPYVCAKVEADSVIFPILGQDQMKWAIGQAVPDEISGQMFIMSGTA